LAIAERKLQQVHFSAGQDLPGWFCALEKKRKLQR